MMPVAASTTAGLLGLFIFISIFAFVIVSLLRKGAREAAAKHASIPFKED